MKENRSFEIFYNTLSIGWHLRKVAEADPDFKLEGDSFDKFIKWLERHQLKTTKK